MSSIGSGIGVSSLAGRCRSFTHPNSGRLWVLFKISSQYSRTDGDIHCLNSVCLTKFSARCFRSSATLIKTSFLTKKKWKRPNFEVLHSKLQSLSGVHA
ncbi:Uncharacterised protein [Vibrio cholerae]|nr:Uncharacterised protein [Vibrio cholerae]CSB75724.1 Uncharacterised protein [Vibrio cholerae]